MANGGLFPAKRKEGNWLWQHSLGLTLTVLLTLQTAHAIWAGHHVWVQESRTHGDKASGWPVDFWIWWSWEYNVSLVADTFGVLLIVMLSKWLYEKGSSEG